MPRPPYLADATATERSRIDATREGLIDHLLTERLTQGAWEGELSTSALSTATAVAALQLWQRSGRSGVGLLVHNGLRWLIDHPNEDGGYGDTVESPSNISTSTLAWFALSMTEEPAALPVRAQLEAWLERNVGSLDRATFARSIRAAYGKDQTFSVPILTLGALCGCFGEGRDAWSGIPALPFELAALPHRTFQFLGLPMVSYALPALIGIGQAIHHHKGSGGPWRPVRNRAIEPTLRVLESIQPSSGGFLEATPLTSFVMASLIGIGRGDHPVVTRGLEFLRNSVRGDGSWPIDTHLATWVTSLAVEALTCGGRELLDADARQDVTRVLVAQQYTDVHPYTHAAPGGWAWTHLSGGVPDADDTPAALLALHALGHRDARTIEAGLGWLVDLANRDGGLPTFCRGWGKLPFDRSSPDLTAHALRAWAVWQDHVSPEVSARITRGRQRATRYLVRNQRADGAFVPLWFGNQHEEQLENPLYGTSRVLKAASCGEGEAWQKAIKRAVAWTLSVQGEDGGFGGGPGLPPSIEETGLAIDGLCSSGHDSPELRRAVLRGSLWLSEATELGEHLPTTPIGLYFAKLWYSERLYPGLFAASALEKATASPH